MSAVPGSSQASRLAAFALGWRTAQVFFACALASVLSVEAIDARTVIPIVGRYLALTVFRRLFED